MAFFSLFKNQNKPRGFQLQHRYYDERKERLAQLGQEAPKNREARKQRLHEAWTSNRRLKTSSKNQFLRSAAIVLALLVLASLLLR
jgi:hypothetical protein